MSTPGPVPLSNLIRLYRVKAGLTQEELARRSGLSGRAISDLERSLRTTPRMETLRMLASALELTSEQRVSLFTAARPAILGTIPAGANIDVSSGSNGQELPNRRSALPIPPTLLVGRELELAHLQTLFESPDVRLVTLIGPGGVGKTRLAIEVAKKISSRMAEETAFVDLTTVTRPEVLAEAIGESLALPGALNRQPVDALCFDLQTRSLLLLLDNFEHLLDAAPVVSKLLEVCVNLRILVTSRERLQLRGEHVFPVSPLPLPDANSPPETLTFVIESPAVQLFLERAREARLDLKLDDGDAKSIAQICTRLDGLPLAIELAASWMRHEPAAALLARLDHRLPALTGGARDLPHRQQTLRNTIAWSYDLLPPSQQSLFRYLCVFPGGFTLEAAIAIAGLQAASLLKKPPQASTSPSEQLPPLDTVIALMEHSLILQSASPDQSYRFAILESVREFGLDALAALGEETAARQHLVTWFVSLTDAPRLEALDGYIGSGPFALPYDQDNLRSALAFAIENGDLTSAVRIALKLSPLWWEHGLYTEARAALDGILAHAGDLDPILLGIVLGWAAEWAWLQSDYQRTHDLASDALAICQSVGHESGAAANLYRLGRVATALDPAAANPLLQDALAINRRLGNDREAAWTLLGIGYAATMLGDLAGAENSFGQATAMLETLDDPARGGLAVSCTLARGWNVFQMGEIDLAKSMLEQALIDCRDQKYEFGECNALRLLGRVAREQGALEQSALFHLEALRMSQQQGSPRRECSCLIELASIAQASGKSKRAARLLGAEASLRRQLGHMYTPDELGTQTSTLAAAREVLGETEFAGAWQSGESLPWDARLAEAVLVSPTLSNQ